MGTLCLMDTNAVIEFLSGMLPPDASNWLEHQMRAQVGYISVINQIELLGFTAPKHELKEM